MTWPTSRLSPPTQPPVMMGKINVELLPLILPIPDRPKTGPEFWTFHTGFQFNPAQHQHELTIILKMSTFFKFDVNFVPILAPQFHFLTVSAQTVGQIARC